MTASATQCEKNSEPKIPTNNDEQATIIVWAMTLSLLALQLGYEFGRSLYYLLNKST